MKRNPTNYHEIDVLLTSAIDKQPICKEEIYELFTTTPPKKRLALPEKTVRIRYFGHACILIETLDCSILIDAAISYKYPGEISRYTYEDLPENIDYLLITHAHQDHVLLEHLIQLRHCINTVIVPKSGNGELQDPSLMLFFKQLAFNKVLEIDEMGVFSIPNGKVTGIPFLGEHSDLNIRSKTAYLIEIFGHKILAAADSNNIEPEMYKHIHQITGDIETIFLGMECDGAPMNWLYGGLFSKPVPHEQNQSRRLNGSDYESAISILKTFNCRQAYVYAMGQEPWLSYIMGMHCHENAKPITESNKLINYCAENGIVAERLFGEKEIII